MNFLNKVKKTMLAMLLVLAVLPAALAYPVNYPYPNSFTNGQTIGAYTTQMGAYSMQDPYAEGFYDYNSPPIGLTHYGADYNINNIRFAIYPNFPATNVPSRYDPFYGYDAYSYPSYEDQYQGYMMPNAW